MRLEDTWPPGKGNPRRTYMLGALALRREVLHSHRGLSQRTRNQPACGSSLTHPGETLGTHTEHCCSGLETTGAHWSETTKPYRGPRNHPGCPLVGHPHMDSGGGQGAHNTQIHNRVRRNTTRGWGRAGPRKLHGAHQSLPFPSRPRASTVAPLLPRAHGTSPARPLWASTGSTFKHSQG